MQPIETRLAVLDLCIGLGSALAAVALTSVVLQMMRAARVPGLTRCVVRLAAPTSVMGLLVALIAVAGLRGLAPWSWRIVPGLACAGVLFLCGYAVRLRWTLSGEHIGLLAMRQLRPADLSIWRQLAGFHVIQTVYTDAVRRGNDSAATGLAFALSDLVLAQAAVERRQKACESLETVHSLASGCLAAASTGSLEAARQCGRVLAATLLCAIACDPVGDGFVEHLAEVIRRTRWEGSGRALALWTGMRETLFQNASTGHAFVLRYWRQQRGWTSDDPRWAMRVAEGVAALHRASMAVLEDGDGSCGTEDIATQTLAAAYRDIAIEVGPTLRRLRRTPLPVRRSDLPLALLDSIQSRALWDELRDDPHARVVLANAYEQARADLTRTFYGTRPARAASSVVGV